MDFDWSPEEEAFRQEVRAFIAENLTDDVRGSIFIDTPARVAFVDKMAERGWLGMGFPEEYGGSKQPIALAQFILNVELDLAGAPIVGKNVGVIANTIFHEGSEELKREFLPKIFRNEGQWALSYSEPGAGTDIGALQCAAVDEGDYFEVTGTKLYITCCSARPSTRATTSRSREPSSTSRPRTSPAGTGWRSERTRRHRSTRASVCSSWTPAPRG
jgi:alkylation response protein AidB-like acyl-CoA dehydrogenase